jgi:GAF domain-containing protein
VLDNFNTPAAFTTEDETLLLSLSQQVGLSLQNVRLVQTTQERAVQLEALTDAATTLTASLQTESWWIPCSINWSRSSLRHGHFWLRDKDRLRVAAARGFPDTERRLGLTIAWRTAPVQGNDPHRAGDPRRRCTPGSALPTLEAPRLSWLGLPLISKNEVIGVLALEKWQAHFYTVNTCRWVRPLPARRRLRWKMRVCSKKA